MSLSHILASVARTLQIVCVFLSFNVYGQTFYVDSINGDDAWSGRFPDSQSGDGPWKTLSKVNGSIFLPGDSVLFKCGGVWREQLDIPSSGNASSPILYGAYGACDGTNKPVFSGADVLQSWSVYSGSTFVTSSIVNKHARTLIEDGSFDRNLNVWGSYLATASRINDCGGYGGNCLRFIATGAGGLVASSQFELVEGNAYRISFRIRADADLNTTVMVRRATDPYDAAGFQKLVSVSSGWRSYSYDFLASKSLANAKIDFYGNASNFITIDDVRLIPLTPEPDFISQLYVNGAFVRLAQYPNPRADQTDTYHPIDPTQDGTVDNPGCPGSGPGVTSFRARPYPSPDSQNVNPSTQEMDGAGVHLRTNDWLIDDRVVSTYDPLTRVFTLTSASSYVLCKDWGFYLDNKLWMLDAPGEWFFDAGYPYRTYIWLPDSAVPADQVEASHREFGIDARYKSYLIIDGLRVEKAGIGINLSTSSNVEIRNNEVRDSAGSGINWAGSGIVASSASSPSIINNSVLNGTRNGIVFNGATTAVVRSNSLSNTGYVGSPKKSVAAIQGGGANGSIIENNRVLNSGYNGINAGINDRVSGNLVENVCLVLDDCGAIYTNSKTNGFVPLNVSITGNVIHDALGNVNGKPPGRSSSAHGIYLDDSSHVVEVRGNTVVNSDSGIQLHNGYDNLLAENSVYGTRRYPAAVSETALARQITVRGNRFESNLFFPTQPSATYRLSSVFDNNDFGTYDLNRYSSLYGDALVDESYYPNGVATTHAYSLTEWQRTRGYDANSTTFDSFEIAALRTVSYVGTSLVTNGTFDSGVAGWGAYLGISPSPEWVSLCPDGGCLRFKRDSTTGKGGWVSTNSFSVEEGKTYLIRFDLKGDREGQGVWAVLRGNGTPNYDPVALSEQLTIGPEWQSYLFRVPATQTRIFSGGSTGARFGVHAYADQEILLDNVVVQEVALETNSSVADDSTIQINTSSDTEAKSCPDSFDNPTKCGEYIRFSDGSAVQWPILVPPMGSEILVWSKNPMKDSDRDGVVDSDDFCPDTPRLSSPLVDERGCSFTQSHSADLSVTLTGPSGPVVLGDTVQYTIQVNNAGPRSATSVVTNGSLASCSLGTISSGGSASCTRFATASSVGALVQAITVSATESDINIANNTATFTTSVRGVLTVSKVGDGIGTVSSNPPGIACGADCTEPYDPNTLVTLTATANTGSVFANWSGGCTGTTNPCTVTINDSKTVTALFSGQPDLVVSSVVGAASGTTGSATTVNVTTANSGTADATASVTGVYLSSDATISNSDTLLGSVSVPGLGAGASSASAPNVILPAGLVTGIYYLGAIADATSVVTEGNASSTGESDNAKTGNAIQISGVPGAPSALTATVNSKTKITLNWVDNASDESGFLIERSTDGSSFVQLSSVGANVNTDASTALSSNTLYYYRVRARNVRGYSAYSETISARTY